MSSDLSPVVLELERHVAAGGWDQPPRLFALARTADLAAREPRLAAALGLSSDDPGWTPVEQEDFVGTGDLEEALGRIGWPPEVDGCALVLERIVLPPEAEGDLRDLGDADAGGLARAAAAHPGRRDVRLAVAVVRSGQHAAAIRVRDHDTDDAVLRGDDLVPGLAEALAATLS